MDLSIVELGIVAPGETEVEGIRDVLESVEHAESAGFHRMWFAEHHLSHAFASHHPELLIAAAAARTSRIRLGSGATLMNHYSPLKVAEMFKQLEAMAPGRVDLGMGRATSGPVIDLALRPDRGQSAAPDHHERVLETLTWLHDAFSAGHPFAGHRLLDTVPGVPQAWLLGSSPDSSARLAAEVGIGFAFAQFINPATAASALRTYREHFRPRGFGHDVPRAILSVNVTVGDSTAEGLHLANSAKGYIARLTRRDVHPNSVAIPGPDEASRELPTSIRDEQTSVVGGRWPRFVAGGPHDVRATLERMAEESGADEILVQDFIVDPAVRRRSRALLAEAFGAPARPAVPLAVGAPASAPE